MPPADAEADAEAAEEEKRRRWWIALIAAAVLIGALIGLALTRDTSTAVPGVTGNQLNVAIPLLEQDGFSVGEVKRVQRDVAANTVLEQDPAASPPAAEASLDCPFLSFFCSKPKVDLTVSAGPGTAKVPGTAGLSREEAEEKLEDAGFEARVEEVNSERGGSGAGDPLRTVGRDDPHPRLGRHPDRLEGPKLAKVPVLVGSQRAVAVQQIRGRGLTPEVSEEESSAPAGEVIRQSPSAGSELPRGSPVSIVVSRGEEKVSVPNLIGDERREAVETLREAGLDALGLRTGDRSRIAGGAGHRPVPAARLRSRAREPVSPSSSASGSRGAAKPNEGRGAQRRALLRARGLAALRRGGRRRVWRKPATRRSG